MRIRLDQVKQWIGVAKLVLPFVFMAKGVDPKWATVAADLVGDAEQAFGNGKGAEKAAAVVSGVREVMTAKGMPEEHIQATTDLVQVGLTDAIRVVNDVHQLKAAPALPVTPSTASNASGF